MGFKKYFGAVGVVCLCGCPLLTPPEYSAVQLPFVPKAINASGLVVGLQTLEYPGITYRFGGYWNGEAFVAFETPNDAYADPLLVNDAGLIVGKLDYGSEEPLHRWVNEVRSPLPAPSNAPDYILEDVTGLNNAGDIVGYYDDPEPGARPGTRPLLYRADGTAALLENYRPPLSLHNDSYFTLPADINDSGIIVGTARLATQLQYDSKPVIWRDGEIEVLNSRGFLRGWASGINNDGWIVGSVYNDDDAAWLRGDGGYVVWIDGEMRFLPYPDVYSGDNIAINNAGDIVATYLETDDDDRVLRQFGVLWRWDVGTGRHVPIDLTDRAGIPDLAEADMETLAINDAGQIVVSVRGFDAEVSQYYLLTPEM